MGHAAEFCSAQELAQPGQRLVKDVEGRRIMVANHDGTLFAIDAHCYHLAGPLCEGDIEDGPSGAPCIRCPWHGRRISLATGSHMSTNLDGEVCEEHGKQRTYRTAVQGNSIWIELPDGAESVSYESDKYTHMGQLGGGLNGKGMGLQAGGGGLSSAGKADTGGGLGAPAGQGLVGFGRMRRAQARAAVLKNYRAPPVVPVPPATPSPTSGAAPAGASAAAAAAAVHQQQQWGGQQTLDRFFRPAASAGAVAMDE